MEAACQGATVGGEAEVGGPDVVEALLMEDTGAKQGATGGDNIAVGISPV